VPFLHSYGEAGGARNGRRRDDVRHELSRANRVVANYNVMGPVKAALEAACRYLAYELGSQGIRVHAMSAGPLKTRAAAGLKDFGLLLTQAAQKVPLGELVDIMDVGFTCAYLATPFAKRITGGTVYVDGGANLIA
jgi:enoyl-[acyl-carrier protein] reductase I